MSPPCPENVTQEVSTLKTHTALTEQRVSSLEKDFDKYAEETEERTNRLIKRIEEREETLMEKFDKVNRDYVTLRWLFICYLLVIFGDEIGVGTIIRLALGGA